MGQTANMGKDDFHTRYQAALQAFKDINGHITDLDREAQFSKCALHADLGLFKDEHLSNYDLDEQTRDRLIAHTRQDVVLAYMAITTAKKQIGHLRILAILQTIILVLLLINANKHLIWW